MSAPSSFEARIALRPRSSDETFDLALAYLRQHARDFLKPSAAAVAVVVIPVIALFSAGVSWGPASCAAIVLIGLAERIVVVYAGRHLFSSPLAVSAAVGEAARRSPAALLSALVTGLPVFPALWGEFENPVVIGFSVVPAAIWPFLIAAHIYVREVLHLEDLPLRRAAPRARGLTSYRFGRALILLIVGLLVRSLFVASVYFAVLFVFGFLLQFSDVGGNLGYLAALLGFALCGPYLAMVHLFDYIDARTRREGWDIQVRFHAIAERFREGKQPPPQSGRAA